MHTKGESSVELRTSAEPEATLRVLVRQPALPGYRVPVLRRLGSDYDLQLTVAYGEVAGLPNAEPEGFRARFKGFTRLVVPYAGHVELDTSLSRLIKETDPDVVVSSWTPRIVSTIWHAGLCRLRGIPFLLWGHGYSKHPRSGSDFARGVIARLSAGVVVYGPSGRDAALRLGVPSQRITIAMNAIDTSAAKASRNYWADHSSELADFARGHGLEGRGPLIGIVSRLDPENQVDVLVQAMARVASVFPNAAAVVVGSGRDERSRLESMALSCGVGSSVRFFDGVYDEHVVGGFMSLFDVFCYPSNAGLSIHHAFAYGLPVVLGTDRGRHNPEVDAAEDGVNSVFFDHGSSPALAETLISLVADQQRMNSLRSGAIATSESVTVENMVGAMASAIREAAGNSRRSRRRTRSAGSIGSSSHNP